MGASDGTRTPEPTGLPYGALKSMKAQPCPIPDGETKTGLVETVIIPRARDLGGFRGAPRSAVAGAADDWAVHLFRPDGAC